MNKNDLTVEQFIARRFRQMREQAGKTQDEIATAASAEGYTWTRNTVKAIEAGGRQIKAVELLFLPLVFKRAGVGAKGANRHFELPDLFADVNTTLLLGLDEARKRPVNTVFLKQILEARFSGASKASKTPRYRFDKAEPLPSDPRRIGFRTTKEKLQEFGRLLSIVAPGVDAFDILQISNIESEVRGDAESKIARKLGVPPLAVGIAAHKLWGRALSTERDDRVFARSAPHKTAESTRAIRGHVTRELVAELVEDMKPYLSRLQTKPKPR